MQGNKGEWSEIYTFLKLLGDGNLYSADENLEKVEDLYFPIIKVLREENNEKLEYLNESHIKVIKASTGEILADISSEEFKMKAQELFLKIKDGEGSFSIPVIEDFLLKIKVNSLKAKNYDKGDIVLIVHDLTVNSDRRLSFSIKSLLGNASTLLNAGETTNFEYILEGVVNESLMESCNNIDTKSKVRDRLNFLYQNGVHLRFNQVCNKIFNSNLKTIDSSLPEIISSLLLRYYEGKATSFVQLVDLLEIENPVEFDLNINQEYYKYKVKNLLKDIALGMVPAKPWSGLFDATGGYIIVKESGEVLCYHLYNMNQFQDYLLKNTRLETASTSRHKFGKVYKENGIYYMKLNLQIRFVS